MGLLVREPHFENYAFGGLALRKGAVPSGVWGREGRWVSSGTSILSLGGYFLPVDQHRTSIVNL